MKLNFFAFFANFWFAVFTDLCIPTTALISASCFGSAPSSPIASVPSKLSNDSSISSIFLVNSLATCHNESSSHSPNQSITHLLNRAGELAVRLEKSGLAGFIVNTTCKFL